jgi:hypothetical protein
MVSAFRHDAFNLFGFALSESDWVLADLLASRLGATELSRLRLEHELEAGYGRPGRPRSLDELRRLARLTRDLELDPRGD